MPLTNQEIPDGRAPRIPQVECPTRIGDLQTDPRISLGLTYIMVGHNLAVVVHLCSEIAVMQNGEIVSALVQRI